MKYQIKLRELLELVVKSDASDLHISCGHPPVLRITRTLVDVEGEKKITADEAELLAKELMTDFQWQKFQKDKEIDFAYTFEDKARFRVNVFYQSMKISVAMRHIPSKIRTIEELNLPPVLHKFAEARQGFVLITGATSQGKSTTLAAVIDEINHSRREHIITIEHPIGYVFEDDQSIVDQREVYQDTLSFARALRSTLREDPDVIMVGEMRDLETMATAITAAETGHLVLATLHTNSASQSIHRIIDVFPPHQQNQIRAQLAASLLGVVSQSLVPRIKGGFIPACEIMFANSAVTNLIRENKIHEIPSVIETSGELGMVSLNKSLADLVKRKEITKESAMRFSLISDDLRTRLREYSEI